MLWCATIDSAGKHSFYAIAMDEEATDDEETDDEATDEEATDEEETG